MGVLAESGANNDVPVDSYHGLPFVNSGLPGEPRQDPAAVSSPCAVCATAILRAEQSPSWLTANRR